jgi:hypothetical protein
MIDGCSFVGRLDNDHTYQVQVNQNSRLIRACSPCGRDYAVILNFSKNGHPLVTCKC